jgi:type 1 glutamine amidotransferase
MKRPASGIIASGVGCLFIVCASVGFAADKPAAPPAAAPDAKAAKAARGADPQAVAADIIDKITKAAPEKPTALSAGKRKVLAFTKFLGFRHGSIPICARMVEILGTKSGAWETVISDDIAMFEPDALKAFDAVFMCSTTGEIFGRDPLDKMGKEESERYARLRKSLLDFVSGGKGFGGSHAATDCCYGWHEYGELIGGYFSGHPYGKIVVKVDDPVHPVNAAFKGQGFDFSDEMYVFGPRKGKEGQDSQTYSREKLRVLLSIDMEKAKLDQKAGKRDDADYAISWVKSHGQGRVFYCSFGHRTEIFYDPRILLHFQDGIQFMLGDLKADTTPTAKLRK